MAVTKKRKNRDQRWVDFKCGHRGYADSYVEWDTAKCPECGKRGVKSMQGPASLERLFRF